MPHAVPVLLIAATEVLLLLQVPPGVASASGTQAPAHMSTVPAIAAGEGLMVTVVSVLQPVPNV
jgi:hypothetical protein